MARQSTPRLEPGQADREPELRSPEARLIETSALGAALAATVDALRSARALCEERDALLRPDLEAAAVSMTAALECLGRLRAEGLGVDHLSASILAAPAEATADLEHVFGHATARRDLPLQRPAKARKGMDLDGTAAPFRTTPRDREVPPCIELAMLLTSSTTG